VTVLALKEANAKPQTLYEMRIKLNPFWLRSLLHRMFFTSNIEEFV